MQKTWYKLLRYLYRKSRKEDLTAKPPPISPRGELAPLNELWYLGIYLFSLLLLSLAFCSRLMKSLWKLEFFIWSQFLPLSISLLHPEINSIITRHI